MPRAAMDYSKTSIYKIVCNDLNIKECYVGHTTDMTKRKWAHKSVCNNEKSKFHNLKIYKIIRENGGWDNWDMLLVEKFPCEDKYQACKREREVYEELDAKMNTYRPYRTQEDCKKDDKEYYQEHKEDIKQYYQERKEKLKEKREEHKEDLKQYNKQYYQEKIKEKQKEKVECEYCTKLLSNCSVSYHKKICKSKPVKV